MRGHQFFWKSVTLCNFSLMDRYIVLKEQWAPYKHQLLVLKVVQQIFGNIFLDYTWKIFFTLDDAVPGTRWPEAKKIGPNNSQRLYNERWVGQLFAPTLSVLSNFRNFRAGFLPYKAKIKNSNLVLIFYFWHGFW